MVALQLPTAGDTGRRGAIGVLTATALALPSHAALMPVCTEDITTACRRPYKFTCAAH